MNRAVCTSMLFFNEWQRINVSLESIIIDFLPVFRAKPKMEMRTCGESCIARQAEPVTLIEFVTDFYVRFCEVCIDRLCFSMFHTDENAIASISLIPDFYHFTCESGSDISFAFWRFVLKCCAVVNAIVTVKTKLLVDFRIQSEILCDVHSVYWVFHSCDVND